MPCDIRTCPVPVLPSHCAGDPVRGRDAPLVLEDPFLYPAEPWKVGIGLCPSLVLLGQGHGLNTWPCCRSMGRSSGTVSLFCRVQLSKIAIDVFEEETLQFERRREVNFNYRTFQTNSTLNATCPWKEPQSSARATQHERVVAMWPLKNWNHTIDKLKNPTLSSLGSLLVCWLLSRAGTRIDNDEETALRPCKDVTRSYAGIIGISRPDDATLDSH